MDFSKFDTRGRSETGARMILCDPDTGEPLGEGDDAPVVIVRGVAARTAQSRLAEMTRKAKKTKGDDAAAMERLHKTLIDTAMAYVAGMENVEIGGEPVTDVDGYRRLLDLTFPAMDSKRDDDGEPILRDGKDSNGNAIQIPDFELVNTPFAKQIIEFAGDMGNFSASASKT